MDPLRSIGRLADWQIGRLLADCQIDRLELIWSAARKPGMTNPTSWKRRVVIGLAGLAFLVLVAFGALYAFMKFSVLPLRDASTLGAYIFRLNEGGVGLVDAGSDRSGAAIRAALARAGKTADEVRAIFLTHSHADHIGGARAFPRAQVYVLEPDRRAVERSGIVVARGLRDGERVDAGGTPVEVFALPGHTPGSAAFLVHGVLFFGDSAAAAYDGSFQPNTLMGTDPAQAGRSVRALAERLRPRHTEIRQLAFGHQGKLDGMGPMLNWAATQN